MTRRAVYSCAVNIRRATVADASALVDHIKAVVSEPVRTAPLDPDEVMTVDQEKAAIEQYAASPRAILLVAEDGGKIVGELTLRCISPRRALEHVASLGMSVHSAYRRRGIGRALLEHAIEWAKGIGITRIELYVFADNAPAIALYEALGFVHEGRRRHFVRFGDTYIDDLVMARLLD
jgi:putative acetyltransferase